VDSKSVKNIFISYRVQDTAGETGRLVDDLKQHFADGQLFMDIDNLEPGVEFDVVIEKYLNSCEVMLVVVGPYWLGNREHQTPRINDPNDWVKLEVSSALKRRIRVIPVLVDGACLPKEEELPPELKPLLKRQSYELSNKRWQYDVDRLIDFLIRVVGITPKELKYAAEKKPGLSKKFWIYLASVIVFILVAVLVIINLPKQKNENAVSPGKRQDSLQTSAPDSLAIDDRGQSSAENTQHGKQSLTGTWVEDDPGIKSSFILHQTGDHIKVQVQSLGQMLSEGSGTVHNKAIELRFELLGSPTILKGTLSDDGNRISGTYTMEATGDPQSIVLLRKK
jgi:hypothetical protein